MIGILIILYFNTILIVEQIIELIEGLKILTIDKIQRNLNILGTGIVN